MEDDIFEYKRDISQNISWLKYMTRIFNDFKIDIGELNHYFDADYYGERSEVICKAFNEILSKEKINVTVEYNDRKGVFIFSKLKPQIQIPKKLTKTDYRTPLMPWKDPESLFCDTEFLRKFLGKEPRKGKECKDRKKAD